MEFFLNELAGSVDPALLASEISTLPHENCLVRHKNLEGYIADAEQIPHLHLTDSK